METLTVYLQSPENIQIKRTGNMEYLLDRGRKPIKHWRLARESLLHHHTHHDLPHRTCYGIRLQPRQKIPMQVWRPTDNLHPIPQPSVEPTHRSLYSASPRGHIVRKWGPFENHQCAFLANTNNCTNQVVRDIFLSTFDRTVASDFPGKLGGTQWGSRPVRDGV